MISLHPVFPSMPPRMPLATLATRAHCWPVASLLPASKPRSFSAGQPLARDGAWGCSSQGQGRALPFAEFPGSRRPLEVPRKGSAARCHGCRSSRSCLAVGGWQRPCSVGARPTPSRGAGTPWPPELTPGAHCPMVFSNPNQHGKILMPMANSLIVGFLLGIVAVLFPPHSHLDIRSAGQDLQIFRPFHESFPMTFLSIVRKVFSLKNPLPS